MIAAVKGWRAVLPALLFILPMAALAADDLNGAARELARRTVAYAGKGDAISIAYHNVSSLTPAAMEQLRHGFETALQEGGARLSDTGPVETRLTLSEDQTQYLLIEEVRKADDRQVWMAAWKREPAGGRTPARITGCGAYRHRSVGVVAGQGELLRQRRERPVASRSLSRDPARQTMAARFARPSAFERPEFSGIPAGHELHGNGGCRAIDQLPRGG